jgi:cytochrome c-type biogenesis protein CcmH
MTGFLIVAVLAVVLVLVLLMRPFLWKTSESNVSHRQLNAAIFRDQFAKLDADRAENMIREEDYTQARAELQRRVIEEAAHEDPVPTLKAPKRTLLVVGLILPLMAVGFYLLLGNPGAMDGKGASPHDAQQQDVERMVAGLAKKLENEPDNFKGWLMLARSYQVMGRSREAEKAFDRVGSFIDNDAQMLAVYADISAMNAEGNFAGKPMQLIEKALKADPNNVMALWLAGTAAFRVDDFNKAIKLWERIATQLAPDSEDARTIRGSINEAYARLGKTPPAVAQPPTALRDPPTAPSAASVSGEVDLAAALKAKVGPEDVLMVIARVPGTRMPVAVLRTRAAELPLKFKLDDSLSMSPQARISMASQVEVEARISKSGMAQAESGDLISAVQTVKVGARGLRIQVAKVRP